MANIADGLNRTFGTISGALGNKTNTQPLNKVGYDARAVQNPNLAKLKALGLTTMPEGGQTALDQMWGKRNFLIQPNAMNKMLRGAR